jgi:hypothetical protein
MGILQTRCHFAARLIDRLTPTHVALLALLHDPRKNPTVMQRMRGISMGGIMQVIVAAYPELQGRNELVGLIWYDLESAGLIGRGNALNVTMTGSGMLERRTTPFGDRFLSFISRNNGERRA